VSETLLAVLIGGLLTFAGGAFVEIVRNLWVSRRDKEAREAARQAQLDEIQRGALLDLQEKLIEWFAAVSKQRSARRRQLRATGHVGRLGSVAEDAVMATRKLAYLTERVRDDTLRARLTELRATESLFMTVWLADSDLITEQSLDAQDNEIARLVAAVAEQLGAALRGFL